MASEFVQNIRQVPSEYLQNVRYAESEHVLNIFQVASKYGKRITLAFCQVNMCKILVKLQLHMNKVNLLG